MRQDENSENNGGLSAAKEQLILDHLGFVENLVSRFTSELPTGVDYDNLLSAGVLGLVEAVRNFDPTRGVTLTTFAYPRIRGAIFDELRRNCPIPQRILKNISHIRASVDQFDARANAAYIVEKTDLDSEMVSECLRALRLTRQESWEAQGYSSIVCGQPDDSPEARFEEAELHRILNDAINELPERERRVVQMYYLENLLLREIGDAICVSESRASRILSRAESRLREMMDRRWRREPPVLSTRNGRIRRLDQNSDGLRQPFSLSERRKRHDA